MDPSALGDTKRLSIRDDWPVQTCQPTDGVNLDYLAPLITSQVGDVPSEALVTNITKGRMTVTTLLQQLTSWVHKGFALEHDGSLIGKHYKQNYKSSLLFKSGVHKSLCKRLATNKTTGPFAWTGSVDDLPFSDCAINPIGAVRYKYEQDRARACDDPFINDAITPPSFSMPAMQQLRERAFPFCSWAKSDVEAAFPCMKLAQGDLPWMLFTWYAPDDTDFTGSGTGCLYVHTHGNFGPRPLPHHFTMLMLAVNIAARAIGLDIPAAFIDDNIHTGIMTDLKAAAPAYWNHLRLAGVSDQHSKRE